ncbi:hypothetical protein TWF506_002584 [Arthrobotrys conoides]|uniref:Uncharacterized protein n=1 Tax=Arthrobotrys conoides TaxID=74498 RepID=A0AAN8RRK2_9PEZI
MFWNIFFGLYQLTIPLLTNYTPPHSFHHSFNLPRNMESPTSEEPDLETREQRYLTSCSLLRNLPAEVSESDRESQLAQIRRKKPVRSRTYQQGLLLDRLASLLVANGGGDCAALATGSFTNDKLTLLASYATSGSGGGDAIQKTVRESGRSEARIVGAAVDLTGESSPSAETIKTHGRKIFSYLSCYHSTKDPKLRRNICKQFSIQQTIYSINRIYSKYRNLDKHFRKIRNIDLREYEHTFVEPLEKSYYVSRPTDMQDEILSEELPRAFLDFAEGNYPLDDRQRPLKEYITTHPKIPSNLFSRDVFIIWHELFLWLFGAIGQRIEACIAAKNAKGSQDEKTDAYKRLEVYAENLDALSQLVLRVVDGSCIFRYWAAIVQKIVSGEGEKRINRDNVGLLDPSPHMPAPHGQYFGQWQSSSMVPEEYELDIVFGRQTMSKYKKHGVFRKAARTIWEALRRKKASDGQPRNQLEGGHRSNFLETSTEASPIPGKHGEPLGSLSQDEEHENEDTYQENEEDGDDFDFEITKGAKEALETPLNPIFRLAYTLADYQLIISAILQDRNIPIQIRGRRFEFEVITTKEPHALLKTEALENTLRQFFITKNRKTNSLKIETRMTNLIQNLKKVILSKHHLQQILDHLKEDHRVLAPKHAELLLLEYVVQQNARLTYRYIGISKPPCLVCENLLYLHRPNIRTRKGNGHVYVSEIPKGLIVEKVERVFNVVEELAKNMALQLVAHSSKVKPKAGNMTYKRYMLWRRL